MHFHFRCALWNIMNTTREENQHISTVTSIIQLSKPKLLNQELFQPRLFNRVVDPGELLAKIETQISEVSNETWGRKEITNKKIPSIVDNLICKTVTWEDDENKMFLYDGARLVTILEEYKLSRIRKEEEKKRLRVICSSLCSYHLTKSSSFLKGILDIRIPLQLLDPTQIQHGFCCLLLLTFFFANFGPNATTFVVPVEIFPARLRSTCHGISAASGKLGAIVGAFGFLYLSQNKDPAKTDHGYPPGIGVKNSLIVLGVINLLGTLCTFLVPESKGKSLEEMSGENEEETGETRT
ncbi:putative ABC-type phosphate transporter [Helianthus anomalus]